MSHNRQEAFKPIVHDEKEIKKHHEIELQKEKLADERREKHLQEIKETAHKSAQHPHEYRKEMQTHQ